MLIGDPGLPSDKETYLHGLHYGYFKFMKNIKETESAVYDIYRIDDFDNPEDLKCNM